MPPKDDSNPFESAAAYYARYRPQYEDAVIRYLRNRFELDGTARVLDLGCGTGHIAISLAPHVDTVVGMDPSEEMLQEAQRRSDAIERTNIEWRIGSDADLHDELGTFHLTTMGRSFHWMDQRRTLDRLYRMTEPEGGVAILNDSEWLTRGTKEWQAVVYETADAYLDDLPTRTGPVDEYDDPWAELLEQFGFSDVATFSFDSEREWDIDSIVGYVFSLSFCSPAVFGADRESFETDLRARLDELDQKTFSQEAEVEILSGRA